MSRVLGIDPSLRSTGLAFLDCSTGDFETRVVKSQPIGKTIEHRARRLQSIADVVETYARERQITIVAIESPAYGSRERSAQMIERGALMLMLIERLLDVPAQAIEIAPRQRAKYATGNGNADKMSVGAAMLREHGEQLRDKSDDEIDALILAMIAARALRAHCDETTDYRYTITRDVRLAHQMGDHA